MTQRCKICHEVPGLGTLDCNGPQCRKWREETALKAMERAPAAVFTLAENENIISANAALAYAHATQPKDGDMEFNIADGPAWPVFGPDGSSVTPSFGTPETHPTVACAPATPPSDEDIAGDEIMALESEIEALVEAIARRSRGKAEIETLYKLAWLNWPRLWGRFNGKDMSPQPSPDSLAIANVARKMDG